MSGDTATLYRSAQVFDAEVDLLVVEVAGHRCALRVDDVREVLPMVFVEALPGAPRVIEGIIEVRGCVAPVVSLRRRFGLAERAPAVADRLVIARLPDRDVALHVDAALDLLRLDRASVGVLEHVPAGPTSAGVARLPDGLLVVHALDRFLASDEIVRLDDALARRVACP